MILAALAAMVVRTPSDDRVANDPAWDAIFTRESGWNAGDIGHSIDLGDGRTLWLFGDSIFGPVREGARVGGESKFTRGAVGWHTTPEGGEPPASIDFAPPEPWGDLPPAGWAAPQPGLWPEGTWYWLMGDAAIVPALDVPDQRPAPDTPVPDDPAPGARLILFATAVGPSGNPDGMWNFRRVGGVIITIDNPADPPTAWRATQRINPIVQSQPMHGEPKRASDDWGAAIIPAHRGATVPPGAEDGGAGVPSAIDFYIFGVRSLENGDRGLLVARSSAATLGLPESWSFFDGSVWSDDPKSAAPVLQGIPDEFTIQWLEREGRRDLVLIHSEPMLGRRIMARAAPAPTGPWSEPKPIFEVPDPARDGRLLTYAAKGHIHLSRPGEVLVSYVINSTDFGQIFRDASLYRPRFIRVPHAMLPTPPGLE